LWGTEQERGRSDLDLLVARIRDLKKAGLFHIEEAACEPPAGEAFGDNLFAG
jgi:hypothetical protein